MFDEHTENGGSRSGLKKILTVSGMVFLLSLGLCAISTSASQEEFGGTLGFFSFLAMAGSGLLAVITFIILAVRSIFGDRD